MEEAERRVLLAQPALDTPEGVEPNLLNPNMNALADGIVIAALTITALTVLVCVHFWVFVQKQFKGRLEAVLVISGFGSYIGMAYCLLHISQFEMGWWVHRWDVTVEDTIGFSYWVYVAGLLYNSAIAPVKAAILLEWMRLFSSHSRSAFFWFCRGALWFNIAYYVAAIIVESMRCTPRQIIWDPEIKGTCLNPNTAVVLSSIGLSSDVIMLILPQFVVWRLKLSTWRKFGVALIFAFGLFGTISAILRLVATQEYSKSEDDTYYVSPVCFWALGEITSVFVVYGLPAVPTILAGTPLDFHPPVHGGPEPLWCIKLGTNRKTARGMDPWREGRTRPWKNYRNLDRNSLPANAVDTATTRCTSTIIDPGPPGPPESVRVLSSKP